MSSLRSCCEISPDLDRMVDMRKMLGNGKGLILILVLAGVIFYLYSKRSNEPFENGSCDRCRKPRPCGCPPKECSSCGKSSCSCKPQKFGEPNCPACPLPDPSKWVLKSTIPPCPAMPDMSKYMLKTECPPLPDMSKYVLKSSVPKCPPCISTCSKPCKIGECPPCPRPRCPIVKCPEPRACPACPSASCAPCPEPNIQCKADYQNNNVRPMLASTSTFGF